MIDGLSGNSLLLSNSGNYYSFAVRDYSVKLILERLEDFFSDAILRLNYTDETQWHLGVFPKSLADVSADDGRDLVLERIRDLVSNFIFDPCEDNLVSIHRQKLPPFLPKNSDKGIHITLGMNDSYLEKEGKVPRNFHNLKVDEATLESLKKGIPLDENPFMIQNFGFLFGNESNMKLCDGRTMFVGLLHERCNQIVNRLRDKYLQKTGLHTGVPHMTLAYLSYKDKDGNLEHDKFNEDFCPMSDNKKLESFYTNPKFKFHDPLPFLVKDLFNKVKSEEDASELKTDLINYWKYKLQE